MSDRPGLAPATFRTGLTLQPDLLGWLTAFYSRIRAGLTLFIWGFTWETADMSRDIKSQAENVCSGIRGRVNLDWIPPMWHQALLWGTLCPLADDRFRLSLQSGSSLSGAMQSPSTHSEFPFTFNVFGVLVKQSPGEGAGRFSCKGSCSWHHKCAGPCGLTFVL